MAFNREEVSKLLAQCHRRCCICHRFCGVKMETDHMNPKADSNDDSIENAIPVCFECHAEIHLYNDKHPRGRKFSVDELKEHKRQWLEVCRNQPEIFIAPMQRSDIGPLQALIDELKFNMEIKNNNSDTDNGCLFEITQFDRCLTEGYLSMLPEDFSTILMSTYRQMKKANTFISSLSQAAVPREYNAAKDRARISIHNVEKIDQCYNLLLRYLEKDN